MVLSYLRCKLYKSNDVAELCRKLLSQIEESGQEREHFWAIGLNTRNVTVYIELVSIGSLTASLVHPREVFRFAIIKGVAALILCHNHPSGETHPSQEDIVLTKRLASGASLLGIKILDHVIIGNNTDRIFSFRDSGMLSVE